MEQQPYRWWRELNRYHWFVLVVAALGWLFDTMDQQLFNLARVPAMRELLRSAEGTAPDPKVVSEFGGYATSIFLMGWATGGLVFGVLGDKIGRAKTMLITILVYSICTGLSAASTGFVDFAFYRFLTGLGVGGEFAVGVALVAEVMPERARPNALGLLQSLSAVGNISAALISMMMGQLQHSGVIGSAWRWMFIIGAFPALLAILVRRRLKEPERWQQVSAAQSQVAKKAGSYTELFRHPTWRRHALLGMLLAFAGVVGLWGIAFFVFDLVRKILEQHFTNLGLEKTQLEGSVSFWVGVTSIMLNLGGFFGIYSYAIFTKHLGRKPTFALAFIAAMTTTAIVFWRIDSFHHIFWMIPIMGYCQLAVFGGYAVYFPELFPTHLRSTGTSFCYNVGRFVAAIGPSMLGLLTSRVFVSHGPIEAMRYAGMSLSAVFLIGLAVLPFLPETKNQPLPE